MFERRQGRLGELITDAPRFRTPGYHGGVGGPRDLGPPTRVRMLAVVKKTIAGSFLVANARADRAFLAIQNQSPAQSIWYQFASDAALNGGLIIPPGGIDIYDNVVPIDGVFVWCAAAGENFAIVEGVPLVSDAELEAGGPQAASASAMQAQGPRAPAPSYAAAPARAAAPAQQPQQQRRGPVLGYGYDPRYPWR